MISFAEKYIYKLEGKVEYLEGEVNLHVDMIQSLKNQLKTNNFLCEDSGMSKDDARVASESAMADFEKKLGDLRFHLDIYKAMLETERESRRDGN